MKKFEVPGVFWVALILAAIPIIQQYLSEYAWAAGIIAFLGVAARLIQLYLLEGKQGPPEELMTRGVARPSVPTNRRSTLSRFMFGG